MHFGDIRVDAPGILEIGHSLREHRFREIEHAAIVVGAGAVASDKIVCLKRQGADVDRAQGDQGTRQLDAGRYFLALADGPGHFIAGLGQAAVHDDDGGLGGPRLDQQHNTQTGSGYKP
jgi:hypothetical protein